MGRKDRVALALALGVHALAIVAGRRCAVDAPVSPVSPHADATETAIELDESPSPLSTAPNGASERRAILSAPKRTLASSGGAIRPVPREASPEITAPLEPAPALTRAEAQESPPGLTLAQLGLEGPNRLAVRSPPPGPARQETAEGVNRSIAESLLKYDRSVGLGPEGPAIAAIEEVVFSSTAAVNGRAVLSLIADASGAVTGVTCVDGDHAQWDAIASRIAAMLRNKRLRTALGGRGVGMLIAVTSREELPSGRDPGLEVRLARIPVKRGRGPRSSRIELLDVAPHVVMDDPNPDETVGPPTAAPARFPTAHVELLTIIKVEGDPVDLGAKARRVVHAQVLEEHPL